MNFTVNQLKACQVDLKKWAGIIMTVKQVKSLMAVKTPMSEWLAGDFKTAEPTPKWGMDTMPRDYLFDHVARVIVKANNWPLNGDGPTSFFKRLSKALDKKNIKHTF